MEPAYEFKMVQLPQTFVLKQDTGKEIAAYLEKLSRDLGAQGWNQAIHDLLQRRHLPQTKARRLNKKSPLRGLAHTLGRNASKTSAITSNPNKTEIAWCSLANRFKIGRFKSIAFNTPESSRSTASGSLLS